MKEFDTRWVLVPIISILAYTIGDVSLWVVALVVIGSFRIGIKTEVN